jgi:Mg-chelatase subunit ChlD
MLKDKVIAYAKGLVEKFATEVKGRPIYSLVSVYNDDAELIHEASTDFVGLITKLENLKTGGKTNVIPAFKKIKNLTSQSKDSSHELIIITDGKFNTTSENAFNDAVVACQTYCKSIHKIRVVDAEKGIVKLEQAKKFASKINASYEPLLH